MCGEPTRKAGHILPSSKRHKTLRDPPSGRPPAWGMGMKTYGVTPRDEITAAVPDCTLCTWVAVGYRVMKLKCVSRLCDVHGTIPRL